ncbi:unnamed protein product [Urochloa humidicola]
MAPTTTTEAASVKGEGDGARGGNGCERDAEKLEFIEDKTKNFDAKQVCFKACVPVITYEELRLGIFRRSSASPTARLDPPRRAGKLTRPPGSSTATRWV